MTYTKFMIGIHGSTPSNLLDAIAELQDASLIFMSRWNSGELERVESVSKRALTLLDFIANELLRQEVHHIGTGTYAGTQFATEMALLCGQGVTGATLADQKGMVRAGPGNGQLPAHVGTFTSPNLHELLNKVKHRNPKLTNFRIDAGKHIFVICPDKTRGGAEGIYEFDVAEFCNRCQTAATTI